MWFPVQSTFFEYQLLYLYLPTFSTQPLEHRLFYHMHPWHRIEFVTTIKSFEKEFPQTFLECVQANCPTLAAVIGLGKKYIHCLYNCRNAKSMISVICHLFKITRFDVKVQSSILIDFPVKGIRRMVLGLLGKSLWKLELLIIVSKVNFRLRLQDCKGSKGLMISLCLCLSVFVFVFLCVCVCVFNLWAFPVALS